MDLSRFWAVIEQSRRDTDGDLDQQLENLDQLLGQLPPAEIVSFGTILDQLLAASYKGDLWGAASLINGGCSDDGFDYFRRWVVAQGRRVYEDALRDPDSLAAVVEEGDCECEELSYVPIKAYERVTRRKDWYDQLPKSAPPAMPQEDLDRLSDDEG